jgi:hypothetical protein
LAVKGKDRTPLLQRRNWFVSAGLVFLVYLALLYTLSHIGGDNTLLMNMSHVLPLIALLMVVLGLFDKKREEEKERERAKNRYQTRMEMSKAQRELGALGKGDETPAPAIKKNEGAKNETN